jgi:hypothetical protein
MRKTLIGLAALSTLALGGAAMADEGGAAAGAATGAVTGAIVGGPVGAAVGAGVGGIAGGAASGPDRRDTVVVRPDATGSVGCSSTTVHKENSYGESKTVTRDDC